jgi:hypothetical protein
MQIPFLVQQGQFRPTIRSAIELGGGGFPVEVSFPVAGGYNGRIRVKIAKSNADEFHADWESQDWTRFPARIRAAATALRDTNHFGVFVISHQAGTLRITEDTATRAA